MERHQTCTEVIKNIWCIEGEFQSETVDPEYLRPGWYFEDEAEGLNGPYHSQAEAEKQLKNYCEYYLREN